MRVYQDNAISIRIWTSPNCPAMADSCHLIVVSSNLSSKVLLTLGHSNEYEYITARAFRWHTSIITTQKQKWTFSTLRAESAAEARIHGRCDRPGWHTTGVTTAPCGIQFTQLELYTRHATAWHQFTHYRYKQSRWKVRQKTTHRYFPSILCSNLKHIITAVVIDFGDT